MKNRLLHMRLTRGLSIVELARLLDVHPNVVKAWEDCDKSVFHAYYEWTIELLEMPYKERELLVRWLVHELICDETGVVNPIH